MKSNKFFHPYILLVNYRFDPVGWLIKTVTKSKWNHVCLIISDYSMINSDRLGTRIVPINRYYNKLLYKTQKLKLDTTTAQVESIIKYLLNKKHSTNFLFRFVIFLLIGLKLDLNYPNITCSGILAEAFASANIYFNKNKKIKFITPEDINKFCNV